MATTKWTAARVGRAVKRLSTSALLHYREHGLVSTGRKTSSWVYRRVKRALAKREFILTPGSDKPVFRVDFDLVTLRSLCPSQSGTALIQEMPVGLDTITAVEVLVTQSGARSVVYRATFLSDEGEVLARIDAAASTMRGYRYLRIEPSAPIALDETQTAFLMLEPADGVSPSFCVTTSGKGELTEAPSELVRQSNPLAINGQARLVGGSLVYQVFGHQDPLVERGTPHYRVPRLNHAVSTAQNPAVVVYCPAERADRWRSVPSAMVLDTPTKALNALRSGSAQAVVFDTHTHDDGTQRLLDGAWRHGSATAYFLRHEVAEADPYVTPSVAAGQFS